MSKVGIREVATLAGVSTGTVSRVLNDHPSVTKELRARVTGIIKDLGYMPDPSARSMRSKISRLIGIVIPDLTNPFFSELVQSAEQAAANHGYNIIVMTSLDHAAKEADRIQQLTSRKVDGIILVPSNDFHTIKLPKGLPIVVVDRLMPGYSGIAADHRNGVRLGVEHLVKLGHRRIGFISGPGHSVPANDRLMGYLDALEQMDGGAKTAGPPLIAEAAFDYESGRSAGNYLLARARNERPTAIFASSDQQAIGCMRAAHDLGIPVPAALSIMGFDGIPLASMTTPRLTTVKQPIQDVAAAAVAVLLNKQTAPELDNPILFACEVLNGETTAPPQPD
ncbi:MULTISPECIES: LacI family DNA-binding transcriptional regulator [unclassified Rhizobium]|uniref:LacI family DNA-binding transcriptional regulator n=1 Tax=unclassified Rhizobium TaxID=2613769 RepID=UPI001A98518D|nr:MULTISPECIES: LacI family DNA-binding transcriptional regulator [unclassified Rhizobium]MBX5165800.1 LacI family DNA-binding transcriptional regulator [Rhizobium sp. NZLR4b]MBX5184566.1 LacI family DNA-binding transcriptional regulator [Rhizobium sp. NZLR5]MBX5191729.1 LacI family DNA-binding transcriptional regulator [Rhizobium sp. NZLR3b]MBX5205168.1 LacI family DNA-binding transcriptional regulator [Rhizobium sp. NZLR1]MBX5209225.1 LacI family DNA-binding transcriptional regulator [Rhizo